MHCSACEVMQIGGVQTCAQGSDAALAVAKHCCCCKDRDMATCALLHCLLLLDIV